MKRRSVGTAIADAAKICVPFIVPIVAFAASAALGAWLLAGDDAATATLRVGFIEAVDEGLVDTMQDAVIDHVATDEFSTDLGDIGDGAGIELDASRDAEYVALRTKGAEALETEQRAVIAAEVLLGWYAEEGLDGAESFTIIDIESDGPGIKRWIPAAIAGVLGAALAIAVVLRLRRRYGPLRVSRDLGKRHVRVPVIGGTGESANEVMNKATITITRAGRFLDGPAIAVLGIESTVSMRVVELLEARIAAADSDVRLQPVRALSREVAKQTASVLLVGEIGVSSEAAIELIETLAARGIGTVAVVLIGEGFMDELGPQGQRLDSTPRRRRGRPTTPEVIVKMPDDR